VLHGASEQPEVGAAEAERGPEGLAFADDDVCSPVGRRTEDRRADGVERDDEEGAGAVTHRTGLRQVLQTTEIVGVSDDQSTRSFATVLISIGLRGIGLTPLGGSCPDRNLDEIVARP
jgi:hypothetical protein